MTRVVIVGTGALGSRHLQALARLGGPLLVDLVDPVPAARERAVALLMEAGGVQGEFRQYEHIEAMPDSPDVAIVATNSRERLSAIQQLCGLGCQAFILEKVLFTRAEEYALASAALNRANARAWVNCARRASPRYGRLQELIAGRPVSYHVDGGEWGLACNVIHHLDEWVHLTGAQPLNLTGSFEPELIPARRQGYFEVFGRVNTVSGANRFEAISRRGDVGARPGDRVITLRCENTEIVIGQMDQQMVIRVDDQVVAREAYPVAMQSEATAWHVAAILAGGEPSLPRYDESATLHRALLDALMPHFLSLDPKLTECPIT